MMQMSDKSLKRRLSECENDNEDLQAKLEACLQREMEYQFQIRNLKAQLTEEEQSTQEAKVQVQQLTAQVHVLVERHNTDLEKLRHGYEQFNALDEDLQNVQGQNRELKARVDNLEDLLARAWPPLNMEPEYLDEIQIIAARPIIQ